ncbi:hypothetical protein RRG08_008493 [Elysia crispata]|uniref:Uncharacterized protein n=1 Tax=Elysia crispata TaxID=231223 RepID=A0AAE0Z8F5_9GAST|nr:hypothetical protein RRG08_008493 [Elysia crispata]
MIVDESWSAVSLQMIVDESLSAMFSSEWFSLTLAIKKLSSLGLNIVNTKLVHVCAKPDSNADSHRFQSGTYCTEYNEVQLQHNKLKQLTLDKIAARTAKLKINNWFCHEGKFPFIRALV